MPDRQDVAESLDDDKLPPQYPPDEPLAVETYGTTAAEERAGEPLAEAITRENRDFGEAPAAPPEEGPTTDRAEDGRIAQEREGVIPAEEAALHEQGTEFDAP